MPTTTTGLATSFIQFSRPGASGGGATVTDRDGRIKWAGHNLLTNSESFDASAWAKVNATVTANNVVGPNSTTTADTVVATAVGGGHRVQQTVTLPASGSVAVFAKAAGYNWILIQATDASNGCGYWFNVSTGAVGTQNAFGTGFTASNPVVTPVGNGWYKCELAYTSGGTGTTIIINVTNSDNVSSFLGDGTSGVAIWGAHLYRSDLGGMQLNPSMPAGMQSYYPTTPRNLLGFTESLTTGWTNTNTTDSIVTETNPNGLANSVEVTATSANGTLLGSLSLLASPYTFSIWLKRKTGSGNVQLTVDGTTYATVAVTDTWTRFSTTLTPSAGTKTPGIRLVTSGDAVYAWGAQLSDSASLDTYVPQYGAAVTSAAYYAPRLDFDPVTLAAKGLLVEEARTNLLVSSNVFATTWGKTNCTAADNAITSPDGGTTAALITTTTNLDRLEGSASVTSGLNYTLSAFLKEGTSSTVALAFLATNSAFALTAVDFNLSVGTATISSGTPVAYGLVPVGNGWYRCYVTAAATATATAAIRFASASADAVSTYGVYGAQLEAGSFATSYIPTGSATATRAADVASVSTQAFPYSSSEGTIVVSASMFNIAGSYWFASLGPNANDSVQYYSSSNTIRTFIRTGGVDQASFNASGSITNNVVFSFASAFKENDVATVLNGGSATTDTSALIPNADNNKLSIGSAPSAGYLNGHIRQITYLPRRISNAELQSRTA